MNFQENFCRSMNDTLSETFLEEVRGRKRMATARTAEQRYKLKQNDNYKQYETECGGDPSTIYSPN